MAKGSEAKKNVGDIIARTFGTDYVGECGGKYYVYAEENGEKIQVCISMTIPKSPLARAGDADSQHEPTADIPEKEKKELSENEKKLIEDLKKTLGL